MYGESFTSSVRRGFLNLPGALRWILAINVAIFLFQSVMSLFGLQAVNAWMIRWLALAPSAEINLTQPWRFVTYIFLHGHGFHLLFNMLWLWWLGRPVEDTLGPRNFAVLFFGSGIGGGLVHILLSGFAVSAPTIGASGAVFGIMVCFAVLYPRQPIMLILLPPIEARYLVAILITLDVLLLNASDNVARIVHLGGAFWGWLLIKAYYRGYNYDAWIRAVENLWHRIRGRFGGSAGTGPAGKRRRNPSMYSVTDAEILEESELAEKSEMDRILDKISRDGYGSLTAEEKRILFELSKKK